MLKEKTAIQLEETKKPVRLGKTLSSEVWMLRMETLSVNGITTILHIPVCGLKKTCGLCLNMIDQVMRLNYISNM